MLSFLHVAREAGFVVTAYRDEAEGVMEKNDAGQLWLSHASTLHPQITLPRRPADPGRAGRPPPPRRPRDLLHRQFGQDGDRGGGAGQP